MDSNLTDTKTYYPALDALRAIAVSLVLVEHWLHALPLVQVANFGGLGLDLFFVLSGFLITGILLRSKTKSEGNKLSKKQTLKDFFARRVLRIFPLYYVVVIVATLGNKGLIDEALVYNLTYTTNYFVMMHGQWAGNFGHFWSLAVEEQFYLLWPLLILWIPFKWLLRVFALLILGAIVYRILLFQATENFVVSTVGTVACFDALALGATLAYLAHARKKALERILKLWFIPVLLLGFFIAMKTLPALSSEHLLNTVALRFLFSGIAFYVVGWCAFSNLGFMKPVMHWKPLLFMGQISYGMYLFHNFVPGFLLGLKLPDTQWIQFPVHLIALIVIAWVANRLIERPFLKFKTRFNSAQ